MRLDVYLSKTYGNLTRSFIQKLIKEGSVTVNGLLSKPGYKLKKTDKVHIDIPKPVKIEALPEEIPLEIIFEDKDLIVINKPRGLVTHPAPGNWNGTLVNAVLAHCKDLSGIGGKLRPGIVHRLDKDTSGLIIVAKTDNAHKSLSKQLKDRNVKKTYLAVVCKKIKKDEGVISGNIGRNPKDRKKMAVVKTGGREAVTRFKVLKRSREFTLVELYPKTGRTHQIRVHMANIGHPIVGDKIYGKGIGPMLLHAAKVGFTHPSAGKYIEFEIAPPADFNV